MSAVQGPAPGPGATGDRTGAPGGVGGPAPSGRYREAVAEQQYRARPRHAGPTPAQVLGPAVGLVVLLLLLALLVRPASFAVSIGPADPPAPVVAGPSAGPSIPPAAGGQAAPPRQDPAQPSQPVPVEPPEQGVEALAALADLLLRRDAAVVSGDPAGWTAGSPDPTDATTPDGSFVVLTSLPVTRFESSVLPDTLQTVEAVADPVVPSDPAAEGDWQARVETEYELAGATAVVRTDTVTLAAPSDGLGWRVTSWQSYPSQGEVGTAAPWDLGQVQATVGARGVVLSWADPATPDDGSVPPQRVQDAQAWGGRVSSWVERGAVVVDSYLGTGWPRASLVLAPATTAQYDALVPGPAPERPDVFAAVTTDVTTPEGGGDLVVLNPTARAELVDETWQVTVTHELVHVASGARFGDGQEVWLAEGLADLVGWSDVVPATVDRRTVAGRLLGRVADGTAGVPELPVAGDFTAADPDQVGDAYEGAWLAALLLQDELGVEALLALYQDASDGPGSGRQRTDAALRAATGEGREAFQARWAAYLTTLSTAS